MKRLNVINLIGVVLLCGLCAMQWRTNQQLNLEINQLVQQRLKLEANVADEKTKAAGAVADLEDFRQHVAAAEAQLKAMRQQVGTLDAQVDQLIAERDQVQTNLIEWKTAVTARDEKIQALANERNALATRFNELVATNNATVSTLNERTGEFNELAGKYNELLKKK